MVLLILWHLVSGAWPAIEAGRLVSFFTDEKWQPGSAARPAVRRGPDAGRIVLVTLLAVGLATARGLASAVFHRFYAPRRWSDGTGVMELLIGVPAVVFGFWGLMTVVPLIVRLAPETPGQSLLAGGIVLGLDDPAHHRPDQPGRPAIRARFPCSAAAGLGLGRARTIWSDRPARRARWHRDRRVALARPCHRRNHGRGAGLREMSRKSQATSSIRSAPSRRPSRSRWATRRLPTKPCSFVPRWFWCSSPPSLSAGCPFAATDHDPGMGGA
jgi:hypothetical protein